LGSLGQSPSSAHGCPPRPTPRRGRQRPARLTARPRRASGSGAARRATGATVRALAVRGAGARPPLEHPTGPAGAEAREKASALCVSVAADGNKAFASGGGGTPLPVSSPGVRPADSSLGHRGASGPGTAGRLTGLHSLCSKFALYRSFLLLLHGVLNGPFWRFSARAESPLEQLPRPPGFGLVDTGGVPLSWASLDSDSSEANVQAQAGRRAPRCYSETLSRIWVSAHCKHSCERRFQDQGSEVRMWGAGGAQGRQGRQGQSLPPPECVEEPVFPAVRSCRGCCEL
jgi:hypothetical protein